MYDLNEAIGNWRSTFAQNEACGHEDVQELECHLREQIGMLVESGLSEKEAFLIAESRLGDPDQICKQFTEADPSGLWQRRLYWMATGVFCWFVVVLSHRVFSALADTAALSLGIRSGLELGIVNVVVSLTSLLLIVLSCRALYSRGGPKKRHDRLAAFTATRARIVMCIIGVLLAGILGKLLVSVPILYASRVLPTQEIGVYVMCRYLSRNVLIAALSASILFAVLQIARRRGASIASTER
jgi:hypothetical protein